MLAATWRSSTRKSLTCYQSGGFRRCGLQKACSSGARRQKVQLSKVHRAAEAAQGDGIAHHLEYSGLWGAILTFPRRKPFLTNLIIATAKSCFADFLVQWSEGHRSWNTFDFKRNAVFTLFGFAYLGAGQWFVYVTVFKALCPNAVRFANLSWAEKLKDRPGQVDLIKQNLLDNFVHYTWVYLPIFYVFKELIQGEGLSSETVSSAMHKYKHNFWPDNYAIWALWIPADFFIWSVPMWLRMPAGHGLGLIWLLILSWMRGADETA